MMQGNTTKTAIRQALTIAVVVNFIGCSLFQYSEQPEASSAPSSATTEEVAVKPLTPSKELNDLSLELTLPDAPVEYLMLTFGTSREALTNSKKIELPELQQIDRGARLYRYTLKQVGTMKPLFIKITTHAAGFTSPESEVFEVKE